MSKLGDYIERVREVVTYNKEIPVKGLSCNKYFSETHISNLNQIKVPFQLVKKKQFAYIPTTSRNGDKLSLALNSSWDQIQISTTYVVFQIIHPELLNCFYLDLFFKKSFIDKIARYLSTGGVREALSYESFCSIPIVVPTLEQQKKIVYKYQTIEKLIKTKRKMNELLEQWMLAYYHIMFDNLEEYDLKKFEDLMTIIRGGRPPRSNKYLEELYFCKEGGIPWLQVGDISKKNYKFISETTEQLTEEGFKKSKCNLLGGAHSLH